MAQDDTPPFLSRLSVTKHDPLFSTYAAPLGRSAFVVDQGYHFDFYGEAVRFSTEKAGELALAFKLGHEIRYFLHQMAGEPVVTASYSDLVTCTYRPFEHIRVDLCFQVYSSRLAILDVTATNEGPAPAELSVYPFFYHESGLYRVAVGPDGQHVTFEHVEEPDGWVTSHGVPHVRRRVNVWLLSSPPESFGAYEQRGTNRLEAGSFLGDLHRRHLSEVGTAEEAKVVGFQAAMALAPGASERLRLVRGVAPADEGAGDLLRDARGLLSYDMESALREDEALYSRIPEPPISTADDRLLYWGAFNLLRQVMLPPEGACSYNYYVFSREPTWGWGHGGQVFHESLAMLAYVYMDPDGALDSQRVFMERQHEDGYIPYRVGSYLEEVIEHEGERTCSGPFFNWINAELYEHTGDRVFLEEAYASGTRFYAWWLRHRDKDDDGLAEWGGHAVLESLRDGLVAVWHQVGWPAHFEALDLNVMLVKEARSLEKMARALGRGREARRWNEEACRRSEAVRQTFWDDETGFFYHVDRVRHGFTFERENDLKRQEIIGFLPLWAGVATPEQARRLVEKLTNTSKFWRPYGVPTLAADDSYYDPTGYWNGPVWVPWQYLLFRGLRDYGYTDVAEELARRVLAAVREGLRHTHTFWELYSPDHGWAGHHQTYNWTGLVARMILDLHGPPSSSL